MNQTKTISIYILLPFILTLLSCQKEEKPVFPKEPEINLISMSDNIFNFSNESSFILFKFRLRDGDKDMGLSAKDSVFVFEDIRSDTVYQQLYLGLPKIPRETIDGPTLWADVEIPIRSIYFVPRPDPDHILSMRDTLIFKIYCIDDAENKSNVVISDTIFIFP